MVFNPRNQIVKLMTRKNSAKFDDEASLGSTLSAGNNHKRLTPQPTLRKSVSFDETMNTHHESSSLSVEELKELWYNKDDCRHMKDSYSLKHRTISRMASSITVKDSYVDVLTQAYDACCSKSVSESLEQSLAEQLQLHTARIGFEQSVVKCASQQKALRREKLLDLVYNLDHKNPSMDKDALAQLLSKKCRDVSRSARMYACVIGRAQAASEQ